MKGGETMKLITLENIRAWGPCYDPLRYAPEDWSGTALDVLRAENVPLPDRLWVVLREAVLDAKTLRLFAVWCGRQALALINNPDPRSVMACETAERYAHGCATDEELRAARDTAWDAAWTAAWAARNAAGDAARNAARNAAWTARDTAWDAAWTARDAARNAAGEQQIQYLIGLLEWKTK